MEYPIITSPIVQSFLDTVHTVNATPDLDTAVLTLLDWWSRYADQNGNIMIAPGCKLQATLWPFWFSRDDFIFTVIKIAYVVRMCSIVTIAWHA